MEKSGQISNGWGHFCLIVFMLVPFFLTHALALVVLVDEDVVQDEVEQLVLQSHVRVEDERLEAVPAAGHQLVAEDHQQVAEEHEGLKERKRGVMTR